jgi:excinuclease UvrABC nuclease subunit
LEEVFLRRFAGWKQSKSGGDDLPDLFILDGGNGQLGVVKELALRNSSIKTLVEHIDIVALGK